MTNQKCDTNIVFKLIDEMLKPTFTRNMSYLQLAISMVHVWSSKGYLLSSIIQEKVSFNLKKRSVLYMDMEKKMLNKGKSVIKS